MKVLMPGRILNKNVGGNTTYAKALKDGLKLRGVNVDVLKSFRNPAVTMISESLEGILRNSNIIHYVADTGPLVPTRAPSVVTVHGVASRWLDGVRSVSQERIWRTRVRRAIDSTDALITVSLSSAEDIAEVFNCSVERINVIPHGIDTLKFDTPTSLSDKVRAILPEKYILYVGNIEPRKNVDQLVRAMEDPIVRGFGLPLVIAGNPAWNYAATMEAISRNSEVVYLGYVSDSDRCALMQKCDLFIFPSRYEGFGFPVLEAMAAGAPVLTTHGGALRDVAGPSMVIADYGSDAIAHGIERALTDQKWRQDVLEKGRLWASAFTWQESVDAHIGVYESLGNH